MKINLTTLLLILSFSSFSQNQLKAIVLDVDGNEPVEFVGIYNSQNHTVTNADGRFLFTSNLDSVIFYRSGYEKLATTFTKLSDTVYLKKSVFELDEVVVTNAKTIYQKIKDSITSNYLLEPHTETFFIRTILRRNDTMVRLQDMQGLVKRKTSIYAGNLKLDKNDYEIELKQMRQLGILKDENDVYFQFPSLYSIYSESVRLNAMGPDFEVIEKPFEHSNNIKVEFASNTPDNESKSLGHYIINGDNNAILSFNATTLPSYPEDITQRKKYSKLLKLQSSIFFTKNPEMKRYYMNIAKRTIVLEVKTEKQTTPTKFEIDIILETTKSFGNEKVKSNIKEQKDIFKLKFPYNKGYWDTQNQLLLTSEMKDFIIRMGDENKEFKIRSNLD